MDQFRLSDAYPKAMLEDFKPRMFKDADGYLTSIFTSPVVELMIELDAFHLEIQAVIREIGPRPAFLLRFISIEQLVAAVKLYVISWSTLLDVLVAIINVVFDLGYPTRDLSFDRILRNEHIRKSPLPEVFRRYNEPLNWKAFKEQRNNIVHRGRIMDDEIERLRDARAKIYSRRYPSLLFKETVISEEEFNIEVKNLTASLIKLAEEKQSYYSAHYATTVKLVNDVLRVLGQHTRARWLNQT